MQNAEARKKNVIGLWIVQRRVASLDAPQPPGRCALSTEDEVGFCTDSRLAFVSHGHVYRKSGTFEAKPVTTVQTSTLRFLLFRH